MTRALLIALGLVFASAGCDKPSEEDCKKAIQNIRKLTDTAGSDYGVDPTAALRSCRAHASKEAVKCMQAAKTLEDLQACEGDVGKEIFKDDENKADPEEPAEGAGSDDGK